VIGADVHEYAVAAILEEVPDDPFFGELRVPRRTVGGFEVTGAAGQGVRILGARGNQPMGQEGRGAARKQR
jgi:hypothetical protein